MSDEQFRADELVSAYLDGEATPAEIAEIEQDDALLARVEQLRAVRDAASAPVAPMPVELRDQMIEAALAAADAASTQPQGARIVPIHRRRETLLAVAAAAILLAAVVSAGLIASRGTDDGDMAAEHIAAEAPAATAEAEAADEPANVVMATTTAPSAMAAEEHMAEEEPMAEADEATVEAEAAPAATEAEAAAAALEAAVEAPSDDAAADEPAEPSAAGDRRDADTTDTAESGDGPTGQVADLGTFESLESLFDNIATRWSAALEDGVVADSGTCAAAVHEKAVELDVETGQPFIAAVGTEDRMVFDARFARRADGTAVIIYAAPPGCETGSYEQQESDGS